MSVKKILVTGASNELSKFHDQTKIILNLLKGDNDQKMYSCFESHFEQISYIADRLNVEVYEWNESDKKWVLVVKKKKAEKSRYEST